MEYIIFIIGLIVGGIIGYFLSVQLIKARKEVMQSKLDVKDQEIVRLQNEINRQHEFVKEAETKLVDTFKALSLDALKSNSEEFTVLAEEKFKTLQATSKGNLDQHKTAMNGTVDKLSSQLKQFNDKLDSIEKNRNRDYGSLGKGVQSLKDETEKLITALGGTKERGDWGEQHLRNLIEATGMSDLCDFVEQETSQDGQLRADLIVKVPNDRRIVVDSKTVLTAYKDAMDSTDELTRDAKLADHCKHVKSRVQDLSKKEYWKKYPGAFDFVVLYLPGDHFLGVALQIDRNILEDAFNKRVIIATPAILFALLRTVAFSWRQEKLAENYQEISKLGKMIYDSLSSMVGHFNKLGKNLEQSNDAYEKMRGSWSRNVEPKIRRLKDLGATTADDINEPNPLEQTAVTTFPLGFMVTKEDEPKLPEIEA